MKRYQFEIHSDLSVLTCLDRLRGAEEFNNQLLANVSDLNSKPFRIRLSDNHIELWRIYIDGFRDDFKPHLVADLIEDQNGTMIKGYFDINGFVKIFIYIILFFAILICGLCILLFVANLMSNIHNFNGEPVLELFIPFLLIPTIMMVARWVDKFYYGLKKKELVTFLMKTLQIRQEQ